MGLKFEVGDQCIILKDTDEFYFLDKVTIVETDDHTCDGFPYLVEGVVCGEWEWVSYNVLGSLGVDFGATALKDFNVGDKVRLKPLDQIDLNVRLYKASFNPKKYVDIVGEVMLSGSGDVYIDSVSGLAVLVEFRSGETFSVLGKDLVLVNDDESLNLHVQGEDISYCLGVGDSTSETKPVQPVKSDGGSSSYYFTKLPQHLIDQIVETGGIEIKDIVRYCFDNDADCKDIIKALKRIRESLKGGGKEGTTVEYDLNKINFFVNEMGNALKEGLSNEC